MRDRNILDVNINKNFIRLQIYLDSIREQEALAGTTATAQKKLREETEDEYIDRLAEMEENRRLEELERTNDALEQDPAYVAGIATIANTATHSPHTIAFADVSGLTSDQQASMLAQLEAMAQNRKRRS